MEHKGLPKQDWLTVREYAEKYGITVQAVYKAVREGRVNVQKRGHFTFVKDF
jgi:predicted transcriptional regulator